MDDYNLEPGEFLIMQEEHVLLGPINNKQHIRAVALTDRTLILVNDVATGLFKRTTMVKRCPLRRLQRSTHDEVQVFAGKLGDTWWLQLPFEGELIMLTFEISPRRTAERWAEAIRLAAAGNYAAIRTQGTLPPELAGIMDSSRDLIDSLTGGRSSKRISEPERQDASVTVKCVSCHAPLTGHRGTTVTCSYCDTAQTL